MVLLGPRTGAGSDVHSCAANTPAGYRLRPTSKIGEFTRDSSLLSKVGISLAEACRAGTRDGWRTGSRELSNGYIISAARQARCIPGRIRKTSVAQNLTRDLARLENREIAGVLERGAGLITVGQWLSERLGQQFDRESAGCVDDYRDRGGRARARGWVHASIGNPVEPALQLFVKHDPNFPAV